MLITRKKKRNKRVARIRCSLSKMLSRRAAVLNSNKIASKVSKMAVAMLLHSYLYKK
jgi:hypothetical protein